MNLINNIKTYYTQKQIDLLSRYLDDKVKEGNILWQKTYDRLFQERVSQIEFPVSFNTVNPRDKILYRNFEDTFNLINVISTTLAYEYYSLKTLINNHEMFRKDDVNSISNLKNKTLNIVSNNITNFTNISTDNGYIECNPTTLTEFKIDNVECELFPKNYLDKSGNLPNADNLISGKHDYWLTEIVLDHEETCGATFTIDFGTYVNFNMLFLNFACKYIPNITKIEINNIESLTENFYQVEYKTRKYQKATEIYFLSDNNEHKSYITNKVRITIEQERYDFIWKKFNNKEDEILNKEITSTDNITNLLYKDNYYLDPSKYVTNVYSYVFGLYFIRVLFKDYNVKETNNVTETFFFNETLNNKKSFTLDNIFSKKTENDPNHLNVYINGILQKDYIEYNNRTIIFKDPQGNDTNIFNLVKNRSTFFIDTLAAYPENSGPDTTGLEGDHYYYNLNTHQMMQKNCSDSSDEWKNWNNYFDTNNIVTPSDNINKYYRFYFENDLLYYSEQLEVSFSFLKDNIPSTFISNPYYLKGKNLITLKTIEEIRSPFTIEYKLLNEEGYNVKTSDFLESDKPVFITDTYNIQEVYNEVKTNYIKLKHYPIKDIDIKCFVGVDSIERVDTFNSDNLQYIINNNYIFFNKSLNGKNVQITYNYYPDEIYIIAELRTNTDYVTTDCPRIFNIEVNLE